MAHAKLVVERLTSTVPPFEVDLATRREFTTLMVLFARDDYDTPQANDLAWRIVRRIRRRHEIGTKPRQTVARWHHKTWAARKRRRVELRDAERRAQPPSDERHAAGSLEPSNPLFGDEAQRLNNVVSLDERRVLPRGGRREPVSSVACSSERSRPSEGSFDWDEPW
jgi:hypothetical protein